MPSRIAFTDAIDQAGLGLVRIQSGKSVRRRQASETPKTWGAIQRAVNVATAGDEN